MSKIVIIGNGISGVTAARHIRKKSGHEILIISGESEYFFSRTALMYVYMGHLRLQDTEPYEAGFWEKSRIELMHDWVISADYRQKQLHTQKGLIVNYDKLILALGSRPNKFGWPGENLDGVQGLYSRQDLELLEKNTAQVKNAVIVGGGLIGIELAEMLFSRDIRVNFLVREKGFMSHVFSLQESDLLSRHIRSHGIDLHLATELREIHGNDAGKVAGITTSGGENIPCEFVGLTVGVSPNIGVFSGNNLEVNRGILINEYFETSVPDVYAIGDCAEHRKPLQGRGALEQVWYTGRIMGETLAANLYGSRTPYSPGAWFNSAKFFDIEYQTYGLVPAKISDEQEEFYWEHPAGEKSIRLVWNKNTHALEGVNSLGIRLRHELFDSWLRNGTTIEFVMNGLSAANFDPEFYRRFETEIIHAFNHQTGLSVKPEGKKWWQNLLISK